MEVAMNPPAAGVDLVRKRVEERTVLADADASPCIEAEASSAEEHPNAPGASDGTGPRKVSQATLLVKIASERAEFWRTPDSDLFATVEVDGHREHLRIASKQFKQWLEHVALRKMDR